MELEITKEEISKIWRNTQINLNCYNYTGYIRKDGYGEISIKRNQGYIKVLTHRAIYQFYINKTQKVLHHSCGNKCCINPKHLEPLTRAWHLRVEVAMNGTNYNLSTNRQTCKQGHTWQDTYITPLGYQECRICRKKASKKYNLK